MIPNPIHKVLSTIRTRQVRALLMGGQACVLYGAAEFSRDADFVVLANTSNLTLLSSALEELQAVRIAVPPFEAAFLQRGQAVHFRCRHPDVDRLRVDVMTVMRGVAPFAELWARRSTITLPDGVGVDLLSLPDLVQAKKTQRDKDWPMIRRLLEVNYLEGGPDPTSEQIDFWFRELRTPAMLVELAATYPEEASRRISHRPLLALVEQGGSDDAITEALHEEEMAERRRDRDYWLPLKAELEQLRHRERGATNRGMENHEPLA